MGYYGASNDTSLKAYTVWAKRNPNKSIPPPQDELNLQFGEAVESLAQELELTSPPLNKRTVVAGVWIDAERLGYTQEELASMRVLRELQQNLSNYVATAPNIRPSRTGVYFYEGTTVKGYTRAVCLLLFRKLAPA